MSHGWQAVWARHGDPDTIRPTLEQLIAFDGYCGCGHLEAAHWRRHVRGIRDRLGGPPGATVFELGCGAGAFLKPLHDDGHPVEGIDYSPRLIETARRVIPGARFAVSEAAHMDGRRFDLVLANSVFLYFPDLAYAETVLQAMVRKCRHALAVLDLPDEAVRDEYIAHKRRQVGEDYDRRYPPGLDQTFYARQWFRDQLGRAGFELEIEQQAIPGYASNPFRFNVLAVRRE